jgi:hypothetical protein
MNKDKHIIELVDKLANSFTQNTYIDGSIHYRIVDNPPLWVLMVILKVCNEKGPNNLVYARILQIATHISKQEWDAIQDTDQLIEGLLPDTDLSKLTAWLASDTRYVGYLTEALLEVSHLYGAALLEHAQTLWINELASALLSALTELPPEDEN